MDWLYYVHSNSPEWQSHFLTACAVVLAAIKDSNTKLLFTLLHCGKARKPQTMPSPCWWPPIVLTTAPDKHELFETFFFIVHNTPQEIQKQKRKNQLVTHMQKQKLFLPLFLVDISMKHLSWCVKFTFFDCVVSMAVGGVWQLGDQRVMGVRVPGAQPLHLRGCVRASPPGKLP